MATFKYIIDSHIKIWQRTNLSVNAETKGEADTLIIKLAKESPLALENGNEHIIIEGMEYLCDTETLLNSTAQAPTVEVYNADEDFYEPQFALYTNSKQDTILSVKEEFAQMTVIRDHYVTQLHNLLAGLLSIDSAPITFANENDEMDDSKDVIVAYSNHICVKSGRILSVWFNGEDICMKVQEVQYGDVANIKESDLQDDDLFFLINRILNPDNKDL